MKIISNNRIIRLSFFLILFLTIFCISSLIQITHSGNNKLQKCFYLNPFNDKYQSENKNISFNSSRNSEKNIKALINAYLLGPININLRHPLPSTVKLNQLIIHNNQLYLNFNRFYTTLVTQSDKINFINGLRLTIKKNYPQLMNIQISSGSFASPWLHEKRQFKDGFAIKFKKK
jgi:Sporulation and spore germination